MQVLNRAFLAMIVSVYFLAFPAAQAQVESPEPPDDPTPSAPGDPLPEDPGNPGDPEVPPDDTEPPDTEPPEDMEEPLPDGPASQQERIAELAERFGVTEEEVYSMRQNKMGWGEVDHALAIAERIAGKGDDGPSISDALASVLEARASGEGWGNIAKENELKLGDVVSKSRGKGKFEEVPDIPDTDLDEPEVEVDALRARSQKKEKSWKFWKVFRSREADQIERPVRVERASRPDNADKPPRLERPAKIERPIKPEKITKPPKPERVVRFDRPEKPTKPVKPEKPERVPRGKGR